MMVVERMYDEKQIDRGIVMIGARESPEFLSICMTDYSAHRTIGAWCATLEVCPFNRLTISLGAIVGGQLTSM